MICGEEIAALLDKGCEMSILNEKLYYKLRLRGLDCLELPTELINPLTPELNPYAQRCLTRFLLGILLLEACISLIYA
jgi:hypothetical protein